MGNEVFTSSAAISEDLQVSFPPSFFFRPEKIPITAKKRNPPTDERVTPPMPAAAAVQKRAQRAEKKIKEILVNQGFCE